MTDERRRREQGDETDEFGGPLFPDEPDDERRRNDTGERRLRFGPDDTGPLPHWTAPPTGEIPRLAPESDEATPHGDDNADDVDVWSTFTTESPMWRDDDPATTVMEPAPNDFGPPGEGDRTGGSRRRDEYDTSAEFDRPNEPAGASGYDPVTGEVRRGRGGERTGDVPLPPRREPGRITIGTDPSAIPRRQPDPQRRRPGTSRSGRPLGPPRTAASPIPRDMGNAAIAGGVIAVAFVIALMIRPVVVLVVIAAILGVAAWEYFGKITEKGYRPAVAPGLAACVCAPLAAYWMGPTALPLVVALAFVAGAAGFIGTSGVESGPLPNMAVTTMGVIWIGLLGSYAALILRFSNGHAETLPGISAGSNDIGTDTLFMLALGVAVNDIGALVVGSAVGRTPLRSWVSPSKTWEGLVGGAAATVVALWIASMLKDDGAVWSDVSDVMLLALVIVVLAPLGDLTESMFKRNLDIKDFGTIVKGHGGVLDRFDGYLVTLPGVYYLTLLLFT